MHARPPVKQILIAKKMQRWLMYPQVYGANRRIHKDKTLGLSHDRPIMMAVIDTEAKLAAFTPILDQMLQQGLVVLSDVDVIKYTHDYKATDRRQEVR